MLCVLYDYKVRWQSSCPNNLPSQFRPQSCNYHHICLTTPALNIKHVLNLFTGLGLSKELKNKWADAVGNFSIQPFLVRKCSFIKPKSFEETIHFDKTFVRKVSLVKNGIFDQNQRKKTQNTQYLWQFQSGDLKLSLRFSKWWHNPTDIGYSELSLVFH